MELGVANEAQASPGADGSSATAVGSAAGGGASRSTPLDTQRRENCIALAAAASTSGVIFGTLLIAACASVVSDDVWDAFT